MQDNHKEPSVHEITSLHKQWGGGDLSYLPLNTGRPLASGYLGQPVVLSFPRHGSLGIWLGREKRKLIFKVRLLCPRPFHKMFRYFHFQAFVFETQTFKNPVTTGQINYHQLLSMGSSKGKGWKKCLEAESCGLSFLSRDLPGVWLLGIGWLWLRHSLGPHVYEDASANSGCS